MGNIVYITKRIHKHIRVYSNDGLLCTIEDKKLDTSIWTDSQIKMFSEKSKLVDEMPYSMIPFRYTLKTYSSKYFS